MRCFGIRVVGIVLIVFGRMLGGINMRLLNKLYAFIFGYFWLPCPICSEYFGGHEWGESLMTGWYSGKGVCRKCKNEAIKRNEEFMKNNPHPTIITRGD